MEASIPQILLEEKDGRYFCTYPRKIEECFVWCIQAEGVPVKEFEDKRKKELEKKEEK
jgi:hypothetical protein